AANALGALHAARGEQQTAERWYRAAMDAGDVNGAYNLGLLCAAQDRTAQAEQWYRRAAYAGHREAANALAVLLLQAGDPA
ncbi:tetratricopeptide repeat protein, partial [Streptomyces sp. SID9124]|nr:tetratricopeptide repeat protein [Streptomyces sp. SID9124]